MIIKKGTKIYFSHLSIFFMAIVSLYIAMSIDGYIAKPDGSVDWLNNYQSEDGIDYGYTDFLNSVDALIMGRKTYEQVLSFGEYPYKGKPSYILSRNPDFKSNLEDVIVVNDNPIPYVRNYLDTNHTRVWLVGGAEIVQLFLNAGMVDELIITIIPVLLGCGISLFHPIKNSIDFSVKSVEDFSNGFIQINYTRENSN